MSKNYARGGAENAVAWDGSWDKGYLVAGDDGVVTGKPVGNIDEVTVTVLKGTMLPIIWGSISAAPAGSIIIW